MSHSVWWSDKSKSHVLLNSFIEKEIKNNQPKKSRFLLKINWKKKRKIFEFYSIISRSQKTNKKLGSICRRSPWQAHQCDTLRTVDPVSCNKWKWIIETKSDVALNCLFTFISPRLLFSCAFRLAIDGFIDGSNIFESWWKILNNNQIDLHVLCVLYPTIPSFHLSTSNRIWYNIDR